MTDTDDVVERTARAIHLIDEPLHRDTSLPWDALLDDTREHYMQYARAAIAALTGGQP